MNTCLRALLWLFPTVFGGDVSKMTGLQDVAHAMQCTGETRQISGDAPPGSSLMQAPFPITKLSSIRSDAIPKTPLSQHLEDEHMQASDLILADQLHREDNSVASDCGGGVQKGDKVVYWIRHAEGFHQSFKNETAGGLQRDAKLTPKGIRQAIKLRKSALLWPVTAGNLGDLQQRVVVSPLRRALQTALIAFNKSLQPETTKWTIDPDIQEIDAFPCSTGFPLETKKMLKHYHRFDLLEQYKQLDREWINKDAGRYSNETNKVQQRFNEFTSRLATLPEERLVVVSHGGLMKLGLGRDAPYYNAGVKLLILRKGYWCLPMYR